MKTRWLSINLPLSIREFGSEMRQHQYKNDVEDGFIISTANNNSIKAQHVLKKIIRESITDPLGNTLQSERTVYNITKFNITTDDTIGLELIDPPRAVKPFTQALSNIAGFGLTLAPIKVCPLEWIINVEKVIGKVKITLIISSEINISNKALAKVHLIGKQDIRMEFSNFLGNKNYIIDCIKCEIFDQNTKDFFFVELYKNATVKIESAYPMLEIELFTKTLLQTIHDSSTANSSH